MPLFKIFAEVCVLNWKLLPVIVLELWWCYLFPSVPAWVYRYDPETKQHSSQWKNPSSLCSKEAREFHSVWIACPPPCSWNCVVWTNSQGWKCGPTYLFIWSTVSAGRCGVKMTWEVVFWRLICPYDNAPSYYALCRNFFQKYHECQPQWPCGLRHVLSLTTQTLESWIQITLGAWMRVCIFLCCVVLCT